MSAGAPPLDVRPYALIAYRHSCFEVPTLVGTLKLSPQRVFRATRVLLWGEAWLTSLRFNADEQLQGEIYFGDLCPSMPGVLDLLLRDVRRIGPGFHEGETSERLDLSEWLLRGDFPCSHFPAINLGSCVELGWRGTPIAIALLGDSLP